MDSDGNLSILPAADIVIIALIFNQHGQGDSSGLDSPVKWKNG